MLQTKLFTRGQLQYFHSCDVAIWHSSSNCSCQTSNGVCLRARALVHELIWVFTPCIDHARPIRPRWRDRINCTELACGSKWVDKSVGWCSTGWVLCLCMSATHPSRGEYVYVRCWYAMWLRCVQSWPRVQPFGVGNHSKVDGRGLPGR